MKISIKKKAGYRLYGILYFVFKCLYPVKKNKAYFIMTHDSSSEGNCGVVKKHLENMGFICPVLTRSDTASASFIFRSALELATSKYVFTDNAFLPLAYLKIRRRTRVVQLWHGTGTIKKFGQHVNTGDVKAAEKRSGKNISTVVVSSNATRNLYAECFNVPAENVQVLGLPRTDIFFNSSFPQEARIKLEEKYPGLNGKTFILYAPTFRDDPEDKKLQLDTIASLTDYLIQPQTLPENVCLGLRLHPSLTDKLSGLSGNERVLDLSAYRGINTLLGAADILITDYSSVIFEYSLLNRPILFYAYDLDKFENSDRGFYRDYRSYVPGPVCLGKEALAEELNRVIASGEIPDPSRHKSFVEDSFAFRDGKSTDRLIGFLRNAEPYN